MHRSLMAFIEDSIQGADILCILIDAEKFKGADRYFNPEFLRVFSQVKVPKICILNKIDLIGTWNNSLPIIQELNELKLFDEIIPISALKKISIDSVLDVLKKYLPKSNFYYDPELLSVQNERFFVSEMIRETIFKAYKEEIPYSTEVQITEFKEREKGKWFIAAEVIVERKTQKIIMIGSKGEKLKKVGEVSRAAIEEHLDRKVFLELFVKVREKWRDNKTYLKSYGYDS
jgi:GTPase